MIDFELIIERLEAVRDDMKREYGFGDDDMAAGTERGFEMAADRLDDEISTLRRMAEASAYEKMIAARTFNALEEAKVTSADMGRWKDYCDVTSFLSDFKMVEFDSSTGRYRLTERGWAVV